MRLRQRQQRGRHVAGGVHGAQHRRGLAQPAAVCRHKLAARGGVGKLGCTVETSLHTQNATAYSPSATATLREIIGNVQG